jgi:tripartite-type tricarboxylate transporter receptor subunit TctC
MATNVETLIEAAKNLSAEEREQLLLALRKSDDNPKVRRITEIRGLGKEIWQEIDAQDYVKTERDSWEN